MIPKKDKLKHYQLVTAMIQIHLGCDHGLPALGWEKEEHMRPIHNKIKEIFKENSENEKN